MSLQDKVAARFDQEAGNFDAIYTGKKGIIGRTWDKLTRRNIYWRFDFTLDAIAPIEGRRILDVGCGSGRYCVEFARRGASEVTGLDVSQVMLDIAQRVADENGLSDPCEFVLSDILDFKPNKPFDIVTAIGFFDYIPDPLVVLKHLRTITSDKLVASFPPLWAFRTPFRKLWRMMGKCYLRFYTEAQIRDLCARSGFKVDTLIARGPIFMLVASPVEHAES